MKFIQHSLRSAKTKTRKWIHLPAVVPDEAHNRVVLVPERRQLVQQHAHQVVRVGHGCVVPLAQRARDVRRPIRNNALKCAIQMPA